MFRQKWCVALVAPWLLIAVRLQATMISMEAFDNATVQTSGPRAGSSGKSFFNVEGENNGNFASYGVADFNFGLQPQVAYIQSITLKLTQANSSFTQSGSFVIALDASPMYAGIQPGNSPLAYAPPDYGTFQDESQGEIALDYLSGGLFGGFPPDLVYQFTQLVTGWEDVISFLLAPWQQAALTSKLNAGESIRLIIAPVEPYVAATWAGYAHSSLAGPTLELEVMQVPEPAGLQAICCVAVGFASRRRRSN
jgi:hypothetical protein